MRILVDESVELQVAGALRTAGHDVRHISEFAPSEADDWVLAESVRTGALLITADKDFGDLVVRRRLPTIGVVLVRFAALPRDQRPAAVVDCIARRGERLRDAFTVISDYAVRSRRVVR